MSKYPKAWAQWVLAAFLIGGGPAGCGSHESAANDIDGRIRFYTGKIEAGPRLYPVYVQLASAYLDKARLTNDSRWLAEARHAVDRSMTILMTYDAFVVAARIANYAHRHEDAIRWGRRALEVAESTDAGKPVAVALLVEAYSALGRHKEAHDLLPPVGTQPADPVTALAIAGWMSSQGHYLRAAREYDITATLARDTGLATLTTWAQAMAAGSLLDAERPDLAQPRLAALLTANPRDDHIRMHEAERLEAEQQPAEALQIYESLLDHLPSDPNLHAKAWKLATLLGNAAQAQRHFDAAEQSLRQAIDAGEVHTLGALAELYSEAGIHGVEAVVLAERNLRFRRDHEAQAIYANAVSKLASAARPENGGAK